MHPDLPPVEQMSRTDDVFSSFVRRENKGVFDVVVAVSVAVAVAVAVLQSARLRPRPALFSPGITIPT